MHTKHNHRTFTKAWNQNNKILYSRHKKNIRAMYYPYSNGIHIISNTKTNKQHIRIIYYVHMSTPCNNKSTLIFVSRKTPNFASADSFAILDSRNHNVEPCKSPMRVFVVMQQGTLMHLDRTQPRQTILSPHTSSLTLPEPTCPIIRRMSMSSHCDPRTQQHKRCRGWTSRQTRRLRSH